MSERDLSMPTFAVLYEEVVKTCSLESVSERLNRQLGETCTEDDVLILVEKLETLSDEDLIGGADDGADFYWRLRTSISDALVASGEKAIGPLLSALSSPNEKAAQYAARSLGRLRAYEAVDPIIKKLEQGTAHADQLAYIEALGAIGDCRIVQSLLPYLGRSGERNGGWLVRLTAISLGKTGDPSVLSALANVLVNDDSWLARLGAAEGLGYLGERNALSILRLALNDADHRVVKAARASILVIEAR